jgi:hypothetical protein
MADHYSITISVLALAVSIVTAWLTFFRVGKIKMTQPTVIYFGPDASTSSKVFLRALLVSTSKRGRVIESMHVSLARNETHQNFNIWVYGDEKLVRGSGLFVGETGVAVNHHFLAPSDGNSFRFTEGRYKLEVFAHMLGDKTQTLLFQHSFQITRDLAIALLDPHTGLYFDWGPDSSSYLPHIEKKAPPDPDKFLEMLRIK